MNPSSQPIHIFDVYAKAAAGRIMHFDVILPVNDPALALASAKDWLRSIGEDNASVNTGNCCFCHSEANAPPKMSQDIAQQGYAIYKMEGCPP